MQRERASDGLADALGAEGLFGHTVSGAAAGQLAIDHDSGDGSDTKIGSAPGDVRVVQVEHLDLARITGKALGELDGVLADGAAGREDFYFTNGVHRSRGWLEVSVLLRA